MSVPSPAVAERGAPSPVAEPVMERTVYLCRQTQGWLVSVDGALLLSTGDEEEAFRCACDAREVEGGPPLRLLILSGPSAAVYMGSLVDQADVPDGAAPGFANPVVHHNVDGPGVPMPPHAHLTGVAA